MNKNCQEFNHAAFYLLFQIKIERKPIIYQHLFKVKQSKILQTYGIDANLFISNVKTKTLSKSLAQSFFYIEKFDNGSTDKPHRP